MQIFKENGLSIKFWIRMESTEKLAQELGVKIRAHGGQVVMDREEADIWVIGPSAFKTYKKSSKNDYRHRVEGQGFVQDCIAAKKLLKETVPAKKPMRGRPPGKKILFTSEEDTLLQKWLAMKTPDGLASGGRLGQKLYERLVEAANDPNTPEWAPLSRRSWEGLKQRYKTNKQKFDAKIQCFVDEQGLKSDSRYAYEHDRRVNRRSRLLRQGDGEGPGGVGDGDGDNDNEQGGRGQSDEELLAMDDEDEGKFFDRYSAGFEDYVGNIDELYPSGSDRGGESDPGSQGEFYAGSGDKPEDEGLPPPKQESGSSPYQRAPKAGPSRVPPRG
ncbi:BRCT domain-containing protein [Phanerochaete sordida]|uniref:BRCT domain-containing protein n=1 Tax=Phanerochaete sordida TaxID=48140 RepID=A0A9P3G602_9APHY|nr:BRCT domain-containing protein [Phanerochaete sordida]